MTNDEIRLPDGEVEITDLLNKARELSWHNFGKNITFYHPGMFRCDSEWGKYPAISITGDKCELTCDHCNSKMLKSMIFATTPAELIRKCIELERNGNIGCLITGGSQKDGSLPWANFIPAIKEIKEKTSLLISIHSGIIDTGIAVQLKDAGVDQALIDVIGDDETLQKVYHVDFGINKIIESLDALQNAGLPIVPHIIIGLHYGKIKGEYRAINIVSKYKVACVVVVVLMPLLGTPMENIALPSLNSIAKIMATLRIKMPNTPIALGCARPRNNPKIDVLAVEHGFNRIALVSEAAIRKAKEYELEIQYQKTCCSVPFIVGLINQTPTLV
ncbi:MAG: radical SAM protein [bacterium]|nr:radical SAM protein [bacterium]